jgi:hypothetical protein
MLWQEHDRRALQPPLQRRRAFRNGATRAMTRSRTRHGPQGKPFSPQLSRVTLDLYVGFVDAPRGAGSAGEAVPALFEFGDVARYPTHDDL